MKNSLEELRKVLNQKVKEQPEIKDDVFRFTVKVGKWLLLMALFFFLLGFIIGKLV